MRAFTTRGFEHSLANMYFVPISILLASTGVTPISFAAVIGKLIVVMAGNIMGGTVVVVLVYWFVYLRRRALRVESMRGS